MKNQSHSQKENQVLQSNSSAEPDYMFVKSESKTIKVYFDKILYIEGMRDCMQVHTEDTRIMTLLNFKNVQEMLDPKRFVRVHKSYIIAVNKINYIEINTIKIGDKFIPRKS